MQSSIVTWKPNLVPLESNVFSQLFKTQNEVVAKINMTTKVYKDTLYYINKAIEDITLLTMDKDSKSSLVFLPVLAAANPGQTWLDLDLLDAALFQRLLYKNIKLVGSKGRRSEKHAGEPTALLYLFQCSTR